MKKPLLHFTFCLMVMTSFGGIAAAASEDRYLPLIRTYFSRLDAVFRQGSSVAEIDALFELFHKDVQYEHVAYAANFDKGAWRQAFVDNLERGAYGKGEFESTAILKTISGGSHVAVEYAYGTRDRQGSWTQESDGLLIVFGFSGEKIVLVREYWE